MKLIQSAFPDIGWKTVQQMIPANDPLRTERLSREQILHLDPVNAMPASGMIQQLARNQEVGKASYVFFSILPIGYVLMATLKFFL